MPFSTVAAPFYIPPNNAQVFQFLHILTNSCYFLSLFCLFFYNSHLNEYELVSHYTFDLHFLMISNIEHLFCAYQPFVYHLCFFLISIQILCSCLKLDHLGFLLLSFDY